VLISARDVVIVENQITRLRSAIAILRYVLIFNAFSELRVKIA
jgi:hypothetical protein